ncbi:MAG: choice-of-anchor J domain-containing protein [Bacteroidota bacterium]|nr:choice-of-anchor J domain-containing protein [Bacteroidota bacterium]
MNTNRFFILTVLLFTPLVLISQETEKHRGVQVKYFESLYLNRNHQTTQFVKHPLPSENFNSIFSPTNTIIFEESFEGSTGFPSAGWKTVNRDGGGTTGPWFQGNTSVFEAYSGSGYAAANYQGANDFYIDEWLISPRILSISQYDTLTFWHRSPDYSSWDDSIEIRISLSDTSISSFTIKVDYFKTSTIGWAQKRYPLKNYVPSGSNIYVAFRYLIYDGGVSGFSSDYAGIDLVQIVRPQVPKDIKVSSIDFPFNKSKIGLGESIEPQATFQNIGSSVQTNIPVRFRIYPPSGTIYEDNRNITSLNPNQFLQISFGSYIPTMVGKYTVSAYSLLSGDQNTFNDSLSSFFNGAVLLSGSFTVGIGGNFSSIKNAVDSLNQNIISGDIHLSLVDSFYNEPPLNIGPLDYASVTDRVTIKPASGKSPVIDINSTSSEPYGFTIQGASKVIIDGSNSNQSQRNLTINAKGTDGRIGIFVRGIEGMDTDSNIVQNLNIRTGADSLTPSDGCYGILLYGYSSVYKSVGNKILNCDITKHGAVGIASQWQDRIIIENNHVHDWTQLSGENDVCGIWLADGTTNAIVSGNIIGNIKSQINYYWAYGIENSSGLGSIILLYNNMIYNILSAGSGTNINRSIGVYSSNFSNSNDGYYYNSIYLSGFDNSTSASSRTAGFEFIGGSNITVKNNIVYNETNLAGTSEGNKSYCVYLSSLPTNFISNNNDLFAPGLKGVVGYNSGNKVTITDWRNSFTPKQDSLSISADPLFVSPGVGNLHILTTEVSPVNGAGVPIVGIIKDIDGTYRNTSTPDIGADEFTPGSVSKNVSYSSGWNLISVPLMVDDDRKITIFPTAISEAFAYVGSYSIKTNLENGVGYWLKFRYPENVEFVGEPISTDTIDVNTGWNLIGSITDTVAVNSIIQIPPEIIISKFYTFDGSYVSVDKIIPGKGYWVKVNRQGKLVLY